MKNWTYILCYIVANEEKSPMRTVSEQKLPVSEHSDQMGVIWRNRNKILKSEKFVLVSFIISTQDMTQNQQLPRKRDKNSNNVLGAFKSHLRRIKTCQQNS